MVPYIQAVKDWLEELVAHQSSKEESGSDVVSFQSNEGEQKNSIVVDSSAVLPTPRADTTAPRLTCRIHLSLCLLHSCVPQMKPRPALLSWPPLDEGNHFVPCVAKRSPSMNTRLFSGRLFITLRQSSEMCAPGGLQERTATARNFCRSMARPRLVRTTNIALSLQLLNGVAIHKKYQYALSIHPLTRRHPRYSRHSPRPRKYVCTHVLRKCFPS